MRGFLFSGFLALSLAAGLLCGCGSQTQAPSEVPAPPAQTQPAAPQQGGAQEVLPPETQEQQSAHQPQADAPQTQPAQPAQEDTQAKAFSPEQVPPYTDLAFAVINDNVPYFTQQEMSLSSFEHYSALDELGRCGVVEASVGQDIMPTEDRESIGMVKPTGWQTARYNGVVEGNYLYNRCHLIGFQLTGENANRENLITGTRYLNIEGMLPFENMVADYVKETGNHVMYRVTPVFQGEELVARGVLMEGYSVEDQGAGICFCVYAYNVQPGVEIDYATGESTLAKTQIEPEEEGEKQIYIVNIKTEKFHLPSCSSVEDINADNKMEFEGSREQVQAQGYEPCGRCKP